MTVLWKELIVVFHQTRYRSYQGFLSNNTHTHHCYQQWSRTHYSTPHTLWGCAGELASAPAAAIFLADAAVTPPSPK